MFARVLLALALAAPAAYADPLSIVRIAQTNDPNSLAPNNNAMFTAFGGFAAAGPNGSASFTATAGGLTSVYAGNGITPLAAAATSSTAIPAYPTNLPTANNFQSFGASTGYAAQGVVFRGVNTTAATEGIYLANSGVVTALADKTTLVPVYGSATATQGAFTAFGAAAQLPATSGTTVGFRGSYTGGNGIYVSTPTGIRVVADSSVTPTGSATAFSSLTGYTPSISGTYATFRGTASVQGVYFRDFSNATNPLITVTDKNQVLPGTASTLITTFVTESVVSGNKVSVVASAGGTTARIAQYTYDGSGAFTPGVAVQYGATTPGFTNGTFTNFSVALSASNGRIAFYGTSTDGTTTRSGLYTYDDINGVQRVVDTTQVLDPTKTQDVSGSNVYGIGANMLNGNTLAFYATFTDGSKGVYVANLAPVPEPATALCMGAVALGLTRLRKRRKVN